MARNAVEYEEDFCAWTIEQARLLRSGEFSQLDVENIVEELESIGRSDKREIESRLTMLLAHLLKWQVQIGFRSRSWSATIREQRDRIQDLLSESPSLRSAASSLRPALYARARRKSGGRNRPCRNRFPCRLPIHRRANPGRGFCSGRLRETGLKAWAQRSAETPQPADCAADNGAPRWKPDLPANRDQAESSGAGSS
jgi:uncharacterized protein DUF29